MIRLYKIMKEINKLYEELDTLADLYAINKLSSDEYIYERNSTYNKYFQKIYKIKRRK